MVSLKKTINSRRLITGAVLALCTLFIFSTCDIPMGLGDPVDTENPRINILSPVDDQYFPSLTQGKPIELHGLWSDNVGVTELRFEVRDMQNKLVESEVTYTINPDGTWNASLLITEVGEAFYSIKVFAYDKFKNDDLDFKIIRLDIVPPWVERAYITRHPNYEDSENGNRKGFNSELHDLDYYYGIGFDNYEAYRNIKMANIDDYQNETFSLNLEIKSVFPVGASRLNIYDSEGVIINNDGPIIPSANSEDRRNPSWDITAAQLIEWRRDLASGAHYIKFQIYAWSIGSWDGTEKDGQPKPDANIRIEDLEGTCWYPESDIPHIYFDTSNMVNNIKILQTENADALTIDFFDDDRLDSVFYGLVKKEAFDTLQSNAGMSGQSEDAYLQSLITDETKRNAALTAIGATITNSEYKGKGRFKDFPLSTVGKETGEYRLIALVQDGKPNDENFSFPVGAQTKWGVYPAIRIQVQNMNAPLVIIEKPERENVFPNLSEGNGQSFTISGYTLDRNGVNSIHIAWVTPRRAPAQGATVGTVGVSTSLTVTSGEEAIRNLGLSAGSNGWSGGVKVWRLELSPPTDEILNGQPYKRTNFSYTFHIQNDFMYSRTGLVPDSGIDSVSDKGVVNDEKIFVIVADNGVPITKTFRLDGTTQGPQIDITNPVSRHSYHDIKTNLDLKMRVTSGTNGVALTPGSQIIYSQDDGRGSSVSFGGIPTTEVSGEWVRTVPVECMPEEEGKLRNYAFEATNILGITTTVERAVTMSNRPVLESISCSNGAGTYGIGKTLTFEAAFSMSIKIPDAYNDRLPRLRLYKTNPGTGQPTVSFYAEMPRENGRVVDQNGGTILRFVYTIADGDDTSLLYTALDPIENATSIFSYQNSVALSQFANHTNSLQTKTPVTIDATRPSIVRASFVQLDSVTTGTSYFNNGKTLTLKLYASEQIQVSGSPTTSVFAGTNRVELSFSRVAQESGRYVLYFTKVLNEATNIEATQFSWAAYNNLWINPNSGSISDVVGNTINSYGTLGNSLSAANRNGSAANITYPDSTTPSIYPSSQAYIKTTKPGPATVEFFNAATAGNSLGTGLTGEPIVYNNHVYLVVTGTETNLRYSDRGGANPQVVPTGNRIAIQDTDRNNRHLDTYEASDYLITAWQVDVAGNSSDIQNPRQVVINSRAPELQGVDVNLPDGWYPRRTSITFKFYFSGVLRGTNITNPNTSTATATFTITGTGTYNGTTTISTARAYTESANSAMLNVSWIVPDGLTTPMKNIKISNLSFANVTDVYGNPLVAYNGTALPTDSRRPITPTSGFNMARDEFGIRPAGPVLTGTVPSQPGTGQYSNGGLLEEGGSSITLNFDTPVNPVPGKYITIRPYGIWAIPPILSAADFDALYNYSFDSAVKEDYQKWLKNADGNELPLTNAGRGTGRTENLYVKNTHGLTVPSGGTMVRPDTTTKMVLHFNTGLYNETNANNLRTVFNAAKWKWQEIHVPSVTVEGSSVRVPISELQKGRIWEVLVEEGAFTDEAGNTSSAVGSGTIRFWSAGTETPVVRVEKISYDGNNGIQENVERGFVNNTGTQSTPPIDTRVRIDCETPGAEIRYDTVRTRIEIPVNPFTSTANTNVAFFGAGEGLNLPTTNTGYANNAIGNDNVGISDNRDTESFFSRLLVPNSRQSSPTYLTPAVPTLSNGAFSMTTLTNLRTLLGGANFGRGTQWVSGVYIFIGDASGGTTNTATGNTDSRLFTGRRDYIVAVARKNAVTTGTGTGSTAGPLLDASAPPANSYAGMEGVYKTTLLYRQPRFANTGTGYDVCRLLVQGFDLPVIPVVAGFPLRDADINAPNDQAINNYFSKTAYRLDRNTTTNLAYDNDSNCYIWVTWEIVTDWYQKGRLVRFSATNNNYPGNYMNNNSVNINSVAAPYGGIIYRYRQQFYNP